MDLVEASFIVSQDTILSELNDRQLKEKIFIIFNMDRRKDADNNNIQTITKIFTDAGLKMQIPFLF